MRKFLSDVVIAGALIVGALAGFAVNIAYEVARLFARAFRRTQR